ncbi:Predicted DNA-binding transcriptional regulator YafY, contains an HTH and WYL domains [Seinonella peptonophila]|uniref:Predicted DNA-binding transcriptional regulator YafY, contains an HTH and WYL domains n=1 Tax=Seinonella peptonophila TaxID=112248 RepID=A0A1M4U0J5_9BACL|nr:YafY family protein [Seinonella peptonophila]SHE50210.1 Predicted DNA-binding transcriptional regulator YafY, contains an HTH and WYL domains [Seinonella peptonophila]
MKIDRLLAIIILLLNHQKMTGKELSERFEVSLRTIYRDIEAINQAGIPIISYAGKNGGFEIMEHYKLDRQQLSLKEMISMMTALQGFHTMLGDDTVKLLIEKIQSLIDKDKQTQLKKHSEQINIDFNPWRINDGAQEKLQQLRLAIDNKQQIQFMYTNLQGQDRFRTVEPFAVVLKGFAWYVYGYCTQQKDFRIFRLSRLTNLRTTDQTFTRQAVSIEEIEARWGRLQANTQLKLLFQPTIKARVFDYFLPKEIEVQKDGTLLVTTKYHEDNWVYNMILSFGAEVLVLEPENVRSIIEKRVRKIIQLYESHAK